MTVDWQSALERAEAHSPFLKRAMDNRADLVALLRDGHGHDALAMAKAEGEGIEDTGVALRRERLSLALVLAIGDLAGAFDLTKVVTELSDFADRALDSAMLAVVRKRVEDADTSGFTDIP